MEERKIIRHKKESVAQAAAPTVVVEEPIQEEVVLDEITKEDAIATIPEGSPAVVEGETETINLHKENAGRPSEEDCVDVDRQKVEMKLIGGIILQHFKAALKNKELDFNQELQLFKTISPYLGYNKDGNKIAEDVGMDSFAMRYLEVNAKIKSVQGKRVSK